MIESRLYANFGPKPYSVVVFNESCTKGMTHDSHLTAAGETWLTMAAQSCRFVEPFLLRPLTPPRLRPSIPNRRKR